MLDGVILGADSRVTFQTQGTYRDTLQKLIFITNHTVLGFVGDITTAAHLLKSVRKAQGERRNAVILRHWLPRLFAYEFARFPNAAAVTFMVGSVIPSRPNVIEKAAAAHVVVNAIHSRPSGSINGISPLFLQIMGAPSPKVRLPSQPEGLLYTMQSPDFNVRSYEPFSAVAIGSGSGLQDKILQVSDQIFFGTIPNADVNWLGRSMNHFLRANNVENVGGSFPIVKISAAGLFPMSRSTVLITQGMAYELTFEHDRWVQRNKTTGDEIRLSLPWEIDLAIRTDHKFDDLRPIA
jgi:proteasome subunit B (beta)-like protein